MNFNHRFSHMNRWMALGLCLMLILSCVIHPSISKASEVKPLISRSGKPQKNGAGNGKEKKVPPIPPQPGAPEAVLPNLDEARQRQHDKPQAPRPIESTMRSRRKPLESRQGRKVGDPLPPRRRSHHATFRVAVTKASKSSRTNAGTLTNVTPVPTGPVFTDDPLTAGFPIKAVHITELRGAINEARAQANLSAASWAEAIVSGVSVKASHITEMRSRLDEARSALGLSTGGYSDSGISSGYAIKAVHIQELRDRAREAISPSSSDQFVQNFLQWGLGRAPNSNESSYWTDIMRSAYSQGQTSMLMAMTEFGMTVFDSAEYAGRNRTNHEYVYDLYKSYLMREPDQDGWDFWTNHCNAYGREAVRQATEDSIEFHNIVASLTAGGAPSSVVSSLATARVDAFNQSGNQVQARDCEWSVPLVSLPGRAGLDLGLSLSYSSLVWTRSGPYVYFGQDNESVSPGFTIGFPTVQWRKFDAQTGRNVYLLTASGRRVELRQVGTSNVYEAGDSSYLQLIDYGSSLLLRTTDGTQMSFSSFLTSWCVTQIKDRNGNLVIVNNDWRGDIQNVTDTLGRTINFNYDGNANLISITQNWSGVWHTWASFGWGSVSMAANFSGAEVVGTYNGESIPVLTQVGLDDGSHYNFEYTGTSQVNVIRRYTSDNVQRSYTAYDYQGTSDCPRIYQARVWAENWTGVNGLPAEVVTQFSDPGDGSRQVIAPDGTIYKEFYGSNWQKGLVTQNEVWSGGVRQKWTTTSYTQDNTSVSYQTNPRVIETNIYDASGNRRRTTIDYSPAAYVQYGLPYFVSEYAADGATEIRRSYTDYNLSQAYLDRRIIGLVSARHVLDPVAGQWRAKTTYGYDDPARIQSQATTAPGHDQSYDASFTVRGNVTALSHWDVTDIGNSGKALTSYRSYDAGGSVLSSTDPAGHINSIGYSDSFSDGNNGRGTYAYATTMTDADGYSSFVQYNYDFGARTRVQGPPPLNQPNGIVQTFTYDEARRVKRATIANTGAYSHYEYGPNYTQAFASVNTVSADPYSSDSYSIQVFDGLGRVFATATNHPGSAGGYKAQWTQIDAMGRAMKQSNPTEIFWNWTPYGDDAAGVVYTQQTYDWKGRPLETTHLTDGTVKYASYGGCGCAGGEVVTLTDEVGRQQKVYSDMLGRQWKTEIMSGNSVYSTTTNSFNARDQVTLARQFQGNDQSGVYQDTTMSYDGYSRLQSKHVPEQNAGTATVYVYNPDDTVQSVTDARGASATYGYNNRHLVTSITYDASSGITPTANVGFDYDAAGNRRWMTDGSGRVDYSYDQLSRLQSETRQFSGTGAPSGSYALSYDYNLANELTRITDPFGATLNYTYDSIGRLNAVNGSGYSSVSQFASNMKYRAWDSLKSVTYDSIRSLAIGYNSRMNVTSFGVVGQYTVGSEYQYYADGRISYSHDLTEGKFDRSYSYDHMARLTSGFSGSEARGINVADGPYRQTYDYDTWGNLTQRTGRDWSHNSAPVSFTYDNSTNRNSQWQYDAEGNVIGQGTWHYTYDAAGQQSGTWQTGGSSVTQDFDGDGYKVKRTTPYEVNYSLRSSALNGAVVAEMSSQGQPYRRNIYANGQVLAIQDDTYHQVSWMHRTPSNNTEFGSGNTLGGSRAGEYDPLGTALGLDDPYLEGGSGGYGDWTGGQGAPSDLSTGCTWEGMAIGCQFAIKFTSWLGINGRLKVTSDIPGVSTVNNQTSLVRSSAVPVGEEPEFSEGDITNYKSLISTPDSYQSSIVRTHHTRTVRETTQVPCDVQISGDRSRAMVAVALGEGTAFRDIARGQFPKPQVTNEAFQPLTQQEFSNEAYYMASVIQNRFASGTHGSTYADVVNERASLPRGRQGDHLFLGIDNGWRNLNQLGNNGDEYCERARYMMDALNWIFDQGHGPAPDIMFWRGVAQGGGRRPFREGDQRAANTDFMILDPTTPAYKRLRIWTVNGWRNP